EILNLQAHTMAVTRVCFSPDGKRLAAAAEQTGKVWDATTGQELLTLQGEVSSVCFSPDGDRLLTGGGFFDKTVTVWDVKTGRKLLNLAGHTDYVRTVCFSPDERL